jgi:integrase
MIVRHLFRRGNIWFVDFRFDSRRFRISTHSTKKVDASKLANYIVHKTVESIIGGDKFNLSQLVNRYQSHIKILNSRTWSRAKLTYLKRIVKFFGNRPLSEITPYDCRRFQDSIKSKGVGLSSINAHTSTLKNVLNMAVEWGMMQMNPARKLKTPQPPSQQRILSNDEIKRLLSVAALFRTEKRNSSKSHLYYFIKLAAFTGMRRSEILNLKWNDFCNNLIIIRQAKEKRERLIPVPQQLRAELLDLNTGNEKIFHLVSTTGISQAWRLACKLAKIKNATPHALRHTFASICICNGANLSVLQSILGHIDFTKTPSCARSNLQDQQALIDLVESQIIESSVDPLRLR